MQQGILAQAARGGLWFAAQFYEAAVRVRNRAFDLGIRPIHCAPAPVVSVGNLTAGGTGKTPIVAAIADWFTSHGARPVILSRGYRAIANAVNDEKLVLDQLCPGVVHLQDPDRVRSSRIACEHHGASILILDDGFQHRRLARDLDVVLVDALNPWGGGYLLPRGLLREPISALRRANLIVLTRADQCLPESKARILHRVGELTKGRPTMEVVFEPVGLINRAGEAKTLGDAKEQGVAAFCGIGNPDAFRRTLADVGMPIDDSSFRAYPDHYHYTERDLEELGEWARACGSSSLITTQKDLVKIPHRELGNRPLWALEIRARFVSGRDLLEDSLQRLISAEIRPRSSRFQ